MNTNETQLINSMLALAALSANISPEELKEYVNVLSPKENPSKVRSDDRFAAHGRAGVRQVACVFG